MKTKVPYRTVQRQASSKTASQTRKRPAGVAVAQGVSSVQRREMTTMLDWLRTRRPGGYRWVARHTSRGPQAFGWWERVATGKRDVRPTVEDLRSLRRLYDLLVEEHDIDDQVLTLLLDVLEHRSAMDAALTKLVKLIRAKGQK